MKTTTRFCSFLLVLLATAIFISCNKNNSGGTTHLELRLTDAPAAYDAVYIDIRQVEVNVSSDTGTTKGWQTVNVLHPGVYNLLNFKNGIDTLLAAADMPAGKLSQMRLVLGNNNSVVINGQSYALTTPSSQ